MKRLLLLSAIIVVAGVGCNADSPEPATPGGDVQLPESAVAQIEALIAEKAARTPVQRKVSSTLLYAKSGRFAALNRNPKKGTTKSEPQITSLLQYDSIGRVLVDIKGDGADLHARIATLGGVVVSDSPAHRSVRAWLGVDRVEDLAGVGTVRSIRPALMATTARHDRPGGIAKFQAPSREVRVERIRQAVERGIIRSGGAGATGGAATSIGSATSEGGRAHGADRARKFFNTDGTGVKIGVLSDSDDFKEASILSGDLPEDTVTVPGQSGRPGGGEGTAMMEIIHDVAPGAKLFFATAFNSPESFAENIRILRDVYGCDIIVDDIIYFFESPYQDDIIAQAVDDVTASGGMYFSSAGNEGNFDDGTSGTWEGDFNDGGVLATLPSGYTVHDYGNKTISNRIEVGSGPLILNWSDPGTLDNPQSSNDYDLFLLDFDLRNVVLAATDVQDGEGLPSEYLGFNIPPNFRIVVAKSPGAAKRAIRVELFRGELGIATSGASYGHNNAADAIGVAAVDWFEAGDGEFTAGPTTPVELFSGDGYRRIFYNPDGTRIGGGVTFASGGGQLRKNPQMSAADGVSTSLPGFTFLNPFFGTSAAAPHAAAIAGLIKSAVPNAGLNKIRNAMKNSALDIENAGYDRNSGAGIVSAFAALEAAGAPPRAFVELGAVTITPTASDAILPGGSGTITVELTNNGGATATAVTGRVTVTTESAPFVTLTSSSSNYPNLAPGASATNATAFAFSVAPSTPCGAKLPLTFVARYNGGSSGVTAKLFTLIVQTGRPGEPTTFSFTGVVPIPDDDPLGVDIPLDVSGIGPASAVSFHIDGATCTAATGSTTVGVDHTWVGDLIFTLTAPSGTAVSLIRQAGGAGNSGNNFCQTVLVDGATPSIQNVLSSQAPFTGTFGPANPQAAFVGEDADGQWTLNVSDNAFIDVGNVRAFGVDVSGFTCD